MKILLLEDDLNRIREFEKRVNELNERNTFKTHSNPVTLIHTETAIECIRLLKTEHFNLILLDHDLGGKVFVDTNREDTGSEVARWISNNLQSVKGVPIITHTQNPAGAKNIISLVPGCIHVPFIWEKNKFHNIIKVK